MGRLRNKGPLRVPPKEEFKQAIVYTAGLSTLRKWRSRCGGHALTEITNHYEPARFLVIEVWPNGSEVTLSEHRTLRAAYTTWTQRKT